MYKGEKYGRVHHMYKEMLRKFNTDVDVWAAFYRSALHRPRLTDEPSCGGGWEEDVAPTTKSIVTSIMVSRTKFGQQTQIFTVNPFY